VCGVFYFELRRINMDEQSPVIKKLDGLGKVPLPKFMRRGLGVREDDYVQVVFMDGPDKRIEIRPVDKAER
jgi:bifunctional DNA-binding transcriptional regulator/antitoxin component of YhaV-PrlF toxin-antitoxin module